MAIYSQTIQGEAQQNENELFAETEAQREARELSERTGKPKKKPRGKPFKKGEDERRKQEQEGESEAHDSEEEDEDEDDSEAEEGEGFKQSPPPEDHPEDDPITAHIRRIAREEDRTLAAVVDANFATVADELGRIEQIARSNKGGAGGSGAVRVQINDMPEVEIEGLVHPQFERVVTALRLGLNVMLVGPAGCGKTTLAAQAAKALSLDFASVSCSAGMTESSLTGRMLPTGEGGRFEYVGTEFVRLFEDGGLFLLDEMDAADPNVLLTANSALANAFLPLPVRHLNPVAQKHEAFVLMAAANTWGNGPSRQYVGRNQLDASTVSRFAGGVIEMGFDRSLEAKLVPDAELRTAFWAIRDRVEATGLRRVWGTRELIAAHKWKTGAGYTVHNAIGTLLTGWTGDELSKIGRKA